MTSIQNEEGIQKGESSHHMFQVLRSKPRTAVKILGLVILIVYLSTHSLRFNPVWVLAYLGIQLACSVVFVLLFYGHHLRDRQSEKQIAELKEVDLASQTITRALKQNKFWILLVPGEDGLFAVPLLLVGVNPYSAAIAGVLFGLFHYPAYPWKACVSKCVSFIALSLIVLPNSILAMVIGHLIADLLASWIPSESIAVDSAK